MRILVTGASRGIGAAIARRLARDAGSGCRLALVARNDSIDMARIVAQLRASGAAAEPFYADLADPDAPASVVERAIDFCGGLDAVVANAGVTAPGALAKVPVTDWDRLFAVNVRAPWLMAKAAFPHLAQARGAMVAIASASGVMPHAGHGAYSATKAALIMLCRQLGQEWAPHGVRVNCVSPGMIRTPLTEAIYQNSEVAAARAALVPIGRVGRAEDVAGVVSYLLGPDAKFVIGQNVMADGGYSESALGRIPGLPRSR